MLGQTLVAQGAAVHFKQLLPFVEPKIPEWELEGKPQGTTVKHDKMEMSQVQPPYRNGDKILEITIMDFWGQKIPFLGRGQHLEMESSEKKVRTTTVQGFKALETYKFEGKHGELSISVADRFWVRLAGDDIDNPDLLRNIAQHLDLKKLATLSN